MKKNALKRLNAILVLAMILGIVFVHVPNAYSAELAVTEKALTFLTDVVKLDLTKYNAQLVYINDYGPLGQQIVKYTLESKGSKLDVLCNFKDSNLVWCKLYPLEGSPLFAQPVSNALDETKSFLDRYQTFSDAQHLQPMRSMLDTVTELTSMTKAVGDVKLEVTETVEKDTITSIRWTNAPSGITNTYSVIALSYCNGVFESFTDWWNLYKVGNFDVKVGREEAVRIAKEHAQKYSWTVVGNITVSNVTLADNAVLAELRMQPREGNTLYPQWTILLGLDKIYPGGITQIEVFLWADTGDIAVIAPSGTYGVSPSDESQSTPPTAEPQYPAPSTPPADASPENNDTSTLPLNTYLITAVASIIAVVVVVSVVLKKRRK
jgi:hypothetical protein